MAWRSSLALFWQILALVGQVLLRKGLGKDLRSLQNVGHNFDHKANVESFPAEEAWSKDTDNGLEVFSSTCLADLVSWRTGAPWKTAQKRHPLLA